MNSYTFIAPDGARSLRHYCAAKSRTLKKLKGAETKRERKNEKGKPVLIFGHNTISR